MGHPTQRQVGLNKTVSLTPWLAGRLAAYKYRWLRKVSEAEKWSFSVLTV